MTDETNVETTPAIPEVVAEETVATEEAVAPEATV